MDWGGGFKSIPSILSRQLQPRVYCDISIVELGLDVIINTLLIYPHALVSLLNDYRSVFSVQLRSGYGGFLVVAKRFLCNKNGSGSSQPEPAVRE